MKFRTEETDYGEYQEQKYDCTYIYQDLKEQVPKDMPIPKGKRVIMSSFVDASLYYCKVTGRSITGVIHLLNKTPIDFYTKKQGTIETATY